MMTVLSKMFLFLRISILTTKLEVDIFLCFNNWVLTIMSCRFYLQTQLSPKIQKIMMEFCMNPYFVLLWNYVIWDQDIGNEAKLIYFTYILTVKPLHIFLHYYSARSSPRSRASYCLFCIFINGKVFLIQICAFQEALNCIINNALSVYRKC